jgi:hypothetical protein
VFALGQRKVGSWWWYYPLAFAIKNPLPFLIAWGGAVVALLCRARFRSRLFELWLFPALYAGVALLAGMNIGYRHILPIHPFLYLTIGGGLALLVKGRWSFKPVAWAVVGRWLLALVGAWYMVASVRVYPYEIGFFSQLIGGTEQGYRYLVDSNLAWGQAARAQADYARKHPDVTIKPPAAKYHPAPGRYVVNASHLQGIGISDPYAYEWFRHLEPHDVLYSSLLAFDVPPVEVKWVGVCSVPRPPLSRADIQAGVGREGLRMVTFDCTQTWLYAGREADSGIYALHHDLIESQNLVGRRALAPNDPFVARHLAQGRLSFEQQDGNRGVPFVLYEAETPEVSWHSPAFAISDGVLPAGLRNSGALPGPVGLDGPLVFVGAVAYRDAGRLEVDTWWKATEGPVSRPFSVMGHLVSPSGKLLGRSDGLGISPLALRPGDVIVQRHSFAAPALKGDLWLRTGAYWRDTMQRWSLVERPGNSALLVRLSEQENLRR